MNKRQEVDPGFTCTSGGYSSLPTPSSWKHFTSPFTTRYWYRIFVIVIISVKGSVISGSKDVIIGSRIFPPVVLLIYLRFLWHIQICT